MCVAIRLPNAVVRIRGISPRGGRKRSLDFDWLATPERYSSVPFHPSINNAGAVATAQPSLASAARHAMPLPHLAMNCHEAPLHAITGASTHRATRLQNALAHARLPPPRRNVGVRTG